MKYFLFNKALDYRRGCLEGCVYEGGLRLADGAARGVFFSRLLDGQEKGLVWHRLELAGRSPSDACLQLSVYAADDPCVMAEGRRRDLRELLAEGASAGELTALSAPFLVRREINPRDVLLHEARGRFLWLSVELFRQNGESPLVEEARVSFPRESWTDWLPRIYQEEGSGFLTRFLAVFQSVSQETEEKIRASHLMLEPADADDAMLRRLAGWLDAETLALWDERRLRTLLARVPELYERRGTRRGLTELVELYTGRKACVVETFQVEACMESGYKREALERLYGREGSRFYLLVPEEVIPTAKEYEALLQLVSDMAPAHMEAVIVTLKPYLLLGSYTYLGVNSRLGRYRALKLDGLSMLSFTAVGERRGEDR